MALAFLLVGAMMFGCSPKTEKEVERKGKIGETSSETAPEVAVETPAIEAVPLTSTDFLEQFERPSIKIPYAPSNTEAKVAPYKVDENLSNVENLAYFGDFTSEQKALLAKNGFVIASRKPEYGRFFYDQIFYIYDKNDYYGIPSFVTGDAMTHTFHIFYDFLLRSTEREQIYPKLKGMTEELLKYSIETYNALTDERIKGLQLKNTAFFGVGASLLGLDISGVPEGAKSLIEEELKNIEMKTSGLSKITNDEVDFTQMTVRGHYTRDETLGAYFLATMYYGQAGFSFFDDKGLPIEDAILQGLLMTYNVYKDKSVFTTWSQAVDPIDFMVESAEDISIRQMAKILYGVYGENPDMNQLLKAAPFQTAVGMIRELPDPIIAPEKGKSFRFIPQRAVMDSMLMQQVVDNINPVSDRPIYSGLDLMASFGSETAMEIQNADPYNSIWSEYKPQMAKNRKIVEALREEDWQKNLYRGWLWMLTEYAKDYGEGYPQFMQNDAWRRKDLASALGSWAELKHDTVLYGKQVSAQMGGPPDFDPGNGYVEPNLALFEKLTWLLEFTKANLADRDMLGDNGEKIDQFKNMVDGCIALIKKQLTNEAFTAEDKVFLRRIGGEMERICINFVESKDNIYYWYEIENLTDQRMPIVADLMQTVKNNCNIPENQFLHTASGAPNEIFVIYPHQGKLYMGRGGVFSYYEFVAPERYTDEKWQEELMENPRAMPDWEKDLVTEGKGDVTGQNWPY